MLFSGVWNFPSISHANSLIGFSGVLAKAILNVAYGTDSFVSESSTWPLIVGNYIRLCTISKIIKGHMIMYPFIILYNSAMITFSQKVDL